MEIWVRNVWWIVTGVLGGLCLILLIIYFLIYYLKIKPFTHVWRPRRPRRESESHMRAGAGVYNSFRYHGGISIVQLSVSPCQSPVPSSASPPPSAGVTDIIEEEVESENAFLTTVSVTEVPKSHV